MVRVKKVVKVAVSKRITALAPRMNGTLAFRALEYVSAFHTLLPGTLPGVSVD